MHKWIDGWVLPFPLFYGECLYTRWHCSLLSVLIMSLDSVGTNLIDKGNGNSQLSLYSLFSLRKNRGKAQCRVQRKASESIFYWYLQVLTKTDMLGKLTGSRLNFFLIYMHTQNAGCFLWATPISWRMLSVTSLRPLFPSWSSLTMNLLIQPTNSSPLLGLISTKVKWLGTYKNQLGYSIHSCSSNYI